MEIPECMMVVLTVLAQVPIISGHRMLKSFLSVVKRFTGMASCVQILARDSTDVEVAV